MTLFRSAVAAFAALMISVVLVDSANAYPVEARSGTATVTGLYRPIDLQLSLVDGSNALYYCAACSPGGMSDFSYQGTYNGTYASGNGLNGIAGDWDLRMYANNTSVITVQGNIITVASTNVNNPIGYLNYGGFAINYYDGVPYQDKPQFNDIFDIYAPLAGDFIEVTCQDGTLTCSSFTVRLLQDLKLIGPYINDGSEGLVLDDGRVCVFVGVGAQCSLRPVSRVNALCYDTNGSLIPCGGIPASGFRASSAAVPEPASLALVALGLAGLGLARRRRQASA